MPGSTDDAARDAVLAALVEFEHELLDPEVRADADHVRSLLHEDFEEIGASGRHWHRDAIIDALGGDPGHGAETSQIDARFAGRDAVLITYAARTLDGSHAVSRRSSLWVREHGRWLMLYHQGTPVA